MQLIGTLAVVISVLVLAYQGRELAKHTQVANDLAGAESHRELMRHLKSITDTFIRYPQLHAHYYGTATTPASEDETVRLLTIADQHADLLENGMLTVRQIASYRSAYLGEWDDFAASVISQSPVLRSHVRANPGLNPPLDPIVARFDADQTTSRDEIRGSTEE